MTKSSENARFYTWNCVSYLDEESLKRLCVEQAKNWAYALHDKDRWTVADEQKNENHKAGDPKEPHYHVILCLEREKSLSSIIRMFKTYGQTNVRAEPIQKDWIGDRLEYMWHKNETAWDDEKKIGKWQYDEAIVNYSSKTWKDKYLAGEEETTNDQFMDDLLAPASDFSIVRMGRVYGRDFIKNFKSYIAFRTYALAEQNGIYVPAQLAYDDRTGLYRDMDYMADRERVREQNEAVNDFIKKGNL